MLAYKSRIITFLKSGEIIDINGYLIISNGKIKKITEEKPECEIINYEDFIIMPGFIDTHIHLPQVNIRGKWSTSLLEWLEKYVFPEEIKFLDENYAKKNSAKFFYELAKNGTTSAMVFGPPNIESTEIAFEEAKRIGIRTFMGQTLMDTNVPEELKTTVRDAKKSMKIMVNRLDGKRAAYVLTLRFAPACSMEMMKETASTARKLNLRIQTHISEQHEEIELVKKMYGKNYAEVYDSAGVLTKRTVLAHGVHLTPKEMDLIAKRNAKIAHCPSSNFFLHSGNMPISELMKKRIDIGIGTDVAAGPFMNLMPVLRDAYYANPITPRTAFNLLTSGGARVLGIDDYTGSLEPGKQGDFVVLKVSDITMSTDEILSELMFLGDDRNVMATYVDGKAIYTSEGI